MNLIKPSADQLKRMFYVIINAYYSFQVDGDDLPKFWILQWDGRVTVLF